MNRVKKNYLTKLFIPFLLLLLVLAACSKEEPTPTPVPPEPVVEEAATVPEAPEPEATEPEGEIPEISQPIYLWGEVADRLWVLVGYGDVANPTVVEEGTKITATFSSVEPTVSGSGGCNDYTTGYTSADDGGLTLDGPIASTMMACETGGDQEITYFGALETVTNWTINEEGRLELTYDSGQSYEEKLAYAPGETPLVFTTWRLVSYGDPDDLLNVEEGTAVTAVFTPDSDNSGTVAGNATCNQYTTSYTIDGSNISFGPTAGTLMMCPIGADQEADYLAALGTAQTYEIFGANMQIVYDGGVLNYTARNLPLENVLWQVVMVADQPVPEGVEITALLEPGEAADAGTIGGSAGCNSYNSGYTTSHDISTNPTTHFLTVSSPMAMTMMACPDEALAELERSYLSVLETAEGYEIFGDQLLIHSQNGDIQYAADRQPLEGVLWRLISLGDANNPQPPVEGSSFTALFNRLPTLPSGSITGETGCNDYNATFTANLTELKVNLPSKTKNEDCPGGAGHFEQEQQFFLGLNAATSYRILGNVLQIRYGEGEAMQVLNFVASQPLVDGEALDLTPLDGTFWYLSAIGDNPIISGSEITADFVIDEGGTTGTISGSGGCNGYNGSIAENLVIGPLATTAKACETAVMEQEGGYFDWLSKAYAYDRAGDQLLISTVNGVLTFNSTPILDQAHELQNKTWYMVTIEHFSAATGEVPTAFFAADGTTLSGSTGCNDYNGAFDAVQDNGLTIGALATTQAACASDALSQQETNFLRLMPTAVSYSVNGTAMQILTANGEPINFSSIAPVVAEPTAVIVNEDLAETGQAVAFDGSQSIAGSAPIVRYDWDMGDGAFLNGANVPYSYNTAGTYTVKLTVTDQAGQTNATTKSMQITAVVDVTPPTAVIEGPQMAFVGEPVAFSAANSQQGTAAIAGYQWQSGDGNNTGSTPGTSFTSIYSQPGTYYPSVTVADAAGSSDSASMQIIINATLDGTDWILSSSIPGSSISLTFANGTLSGFAGCNTYNAGYTTTLAAGNTNSITVGPIVATGMACTPELASQELAYLDALQTANSYTINGATLTLTTASGPLTFGAAVAAPYVTK